MIAVVRALRLQPEPDMTMKMRSIAAAVTLTIALASAASHDALANGQEFFPTNEGPVHLVYFGILKDARTGRPVRDHAYITIQDSLTGTNIPFTGDRPGHFRSPDVGLVIKELGEIPDPARLSLTLMVPGYQKFELKRMPRRASGAVDVSLRLEPDDGRGPAASAAGRSTAPASVATTAAAVAVGTPTYTIAMWVFAALVAVSAIVAAARSRAPRASTSH
jgi:hypothetical protein